jgi:hypothetical protein
VPEEQGTHLGDVHDSEWYSTFFRQHERVDIWQVDATGLDLEEIQTGWLCRAVIPPERLELVERDIAPAEIPLPTTQGGLEGSITVTFRKVRKHSADP